MPMAVDVYLSHARANAALARAVARYLKSNGLRVWLADMASKGHSFVHTGHLQIARARHHLILLCDTTPHAWQRAEFDFASRSGALHDELEIIPLVRDGYEAGDFSDWLEHYESATLPAGKEGLEAHLSELLQRLQEPPGPPRMAPVATSNPYPGLRPYGVNDARYFFGREAELAEALERLGERGDGTHRRWLRVEGPAGIGKTSFARAGLVPAVVRGGIPGGPSDWRVAAFRPADKPADALAQALSYAFSGQISAAEINELLATEGGLADLVSEQLSADHGLLLVIDHIDDVVTEARAWPRQVERFDQLVAGALEDFDQRLFIITCGRSDLVGEVHTALPEMARAALTQSTAYPLGGLTRKGVGEIVRGPAAMVGRPWPDGLAQRVAADAELVPAEPCRLNWTLRALGHGGHPSIEKYENLGGLGEGLARALDAQLDALSSDDAARARSVLVALVGPGRGQADHLVALSLEDAILAAGSGPRAGALVDKLESGVLQEGALPTPILAVARLSAGDYTRLAHGALPTLWPQLSAWVGQDRPVLERRLHAERAAVDWREAGASEEGLPTEASLAYLSGADLPSEGQQSLRAMLSTPTRHFIEAAQKQEKAAHAKADSERRGAEVAARQALEGERDAALSGARKLRLALLVAALLSCVCVWVAFRYSQTFNEKEAEVVWAQRQRQAAVDQLRGAEGRHLAAERKRSAAEIKRRDTERERRLADQVGERAERSADAVLELAIQLAVEADEYFSHIRSQDGKYARLQYARAMLARLKARLKESPDNLRVRALLARQHTLLGDLAVDRGELRRALPEYEASLTVWEGIAKEQAADPTQVSALAQAYDRVADFVSNPRRDKQLNVTRAVELYGKAITAWDTMTQLEPGKPEHRHALLRDRAALGAVELQRRNFDAARGHLQKAVADARKLVDAKPDERRLRVALVRYTTRLGDVEAAARQIETARRTYKGALGLLEPLLAATPSDPDLERTRRNLRRKIKATTP